MKTAQAAITTRETHHGNSGHVLILPKGIKIVVKPATNMPPESDIKWWVYMMPAALTNTAIGRWMDDVGIGLNADDICLAN